MENERRNVLCRILLSWSFPAVKATRKRIASTHPGTDGCFFVCCLLIYFLFSHRESKYILYLWRRNLKWNLLNVGNAKQCDPKHLDHSTPFAQEAETVGDRAKHSKIPGCCERKWAADRTVTDHGDLTVELTADTLRLQTNHVRTKKEFWYRKRVP